MGIWTCPDQFHYINKALYTFSNKTFLLPFQLTEVEFYDKNLKFLNSIPAENIVINDYIDQFKTNNIITDYCNLIKHQQEILTIIESFEKYKQQYYKLKNQYLIISYLLNSINDNDIINILSDYEEFKKLIKYFDFKLLPIQYISYIIPHLHKFISDCSFNELNILCAIIIDICNNIYSNDEHILFKSIFTDDFNKYFMDKVIDNIRNSTIDELNSFLSNCNIGNLILAWSDLYSIFDKFYKSKKLLDQL